MKFDIKRLKHAADMQGLNQPGLAAKAGVSTSTVNKLFSGAIEGTPKTMKRITKALGLTMQEVAR